jgi:hypothetical protein
MSNHLPNGTVLPHGLLGVDLQSEMSGFNRQYKNTPLRMGIVTTIYNVNDPKNYTGLSTEYDVIVLEQNENSSYTSLTYRNCLSSEGMGSIADYFEKNLRNQTENSNPQGTPNTANQNGAIVILLCLDGFSEKGIIIGGLTHPDRATNLTTSAPQLYGEYNGVNISISPDGSGKLIIQGATDNNGNIISPQGSVTIQGQPNGQLNIITTSNTNITVGGNTNITTTGTANIIAQGITTIDGSHINLGQEALEQVIKGNTFAEIYNNHTHIGNLGFSTSVPDQPMDPSLSKHVSTE